MSHIIRRWILFCYIYILPLQIKPGKYANAGAQVMVEVFTVVTSGTSTLQHLCRTEGDSNIWMPGGWEGGRQEV